MRRLILSFFVLSMVACKGNASIEGDGIVPPGQNNENNNSPIVDDPFPDVPCEGIACEEAVISTSQRIVRLTHTQWERSVRDLLLLDDVPGLSASWIPDTLSIGFFNNYAATMEVASPTVWNNYREAAEALAAQVTADATLLDPLLPANAPADLTERTDAFIQHFGRRAYRRALTDAEVAELVTLTEQVPEVFPGAPSFELHAEYLIRFMLQSPHFLYRIELSTSESEVVALDGFERASRLSYALWNSIPDDTLLDAAANGDLDSDDGVNAQVERMMADPKFNATVRDFHAQVFHYDGFNEIDKDPTNFPNFRPELNPMFQEELERFIEYTVFEVDGSWNDLLLSRVAFLNSDLAELYGVDGTFDETYQRTTLPPERMGLLSRLGFLAFEANNYDPSPIKRGVFINEHITCSELGPVPDDFTFDPPAGNTNRERIEDATLCGGACHSVDINPPGFAFENFDALGVVRAEDNGFPVDTAAQWHLEDAVFTFADSVELTEKIASTNQSHICYSRHWFEYLFGRQPSDLGNDDPFIAKIGQASKAGEANVKEIVAAFVTSDLFLKRAME